MKFALKVLIPLLLSVISMTGIDIKSPINEVSLGYPGARFTVFIDTSGGGIRSITLQGVFADTTATAETCRVILAEGLNVRVAPTRQSALVTRSLHGTVLNFVQVVHGEDISGNSLWGLSKQGHYFWLGGTDCPNG
jgi:hypothetical protein